jgi:hypothetical protein
MKKVLVTLLLTMISFQVQAKTDVGDILDLIGGIASHDNQNPNTNYPPPGYGQVRCTYTDDGWEEHSGGHRSCGQCLAQHGDCNETCYADTHTCRAIGTDRWGQQRMVQADGQDRWMAESRAMEYCRYQGLYYCRIERCDYRQQVVSERSCRW